MMKIVRSALVLATVVQLGCYNTYSVTLEELGKATEGGVNNAVQMDTAEGEKVVVSENTKIGVTDKNGAYHAVSPFNFTLSSRQLVAPDEDLLLGVDEIQTGNVKLVSGTKTALLVGAGVALLAAAGALIVVTAPEKKQFGAE